jgi:hypothetical protein
MFLVAVAVAVAGAGCVPWLSSTSVATVRSVSAAHTGCPESDVAVSLVEGSY